jgi:lactoylglutathione lyase
VSATFLRASPYKDDEMNLPVANVEEALPFYENVMGFQVDSRDEGLHNTAILSRDDIRIGLAENGGDPSQEGCFFEVDDVIAAFEELKERGLGRDEANYRQDTYGEVTYKVFFVLAPDGLCYCLGQRQ